MELDLPISHAVTDGWVNFAETILPSIGGGQHAQAHIAWARWRQRSKNS